MCHDLFVVAEPRPSIMGMQNKYQSVSQRLVVSAKLAILVVLGITRIFILGRRSSQENGSGQVVLLGVGGLVLAAGAIQIGGGGLRGLLLELVERLRRSRLGGDLEGNKCHDGSGSEVGSWGWWCVDVQGQDCSGAVRSWFWTSLGDGGENVGY